MLMKTGLLSKWHALLFLLLGYVSQIQKSKYMGQCRLADTSLCPHSHNLKLTLFTSIFREHN